MPEISTTDKSNLERTANSNAVIAILDQGTELDPDLSSSISGVCGRLGRFTSADDLLSRHSETFNCILVDASSVDLPVSDLARIISSRAGHCPIIVIIPHGAPATTVATDRFRVTFLPKQVDSVAIIDALTSSIRAYNEARLLEGNFLTLTERERQVMKFVVEGLLNKQVAYALNISEITVKAHRGRVMRKMNAKTLPDLLYMAAKLGPASGSVAKARSAF